MKKGKNCCLLSAENITRAASITLITALYLYIGCPIRYLTGCSCPGCGITRAMCSILRFDFSGAWQYNPAIFAIPVFAILLYIYRKDTNKTAILFVSLCLTLLIVYIWRLSTNNASDIVYIHPKKGVIYRIINVLKEKWIWQQQK